jgi:hypothetical protein
MRIDFVIDVCKKLHMRLLKRKILYIHTNGKEFTNAQYAGILRTKEV